MISRTGTGGGDIDRPWQRYLLPIMLALVVGIILIWACALGIILIWTRLPDPRLAVPPPPTREPIPATMHVAFAAEGYSLVAEKARTWKQQACLADVLALYDWTGTKWKATEFGYYFIDPRSEGLMTIRIKPEDNIVEVYRPVPLSANRSIPVRCLMTPPDQWQEKEALDSVAQMLRAELTTPCGEVRASVGTFEPARSFYWSIRVGSGAAMRPLLADLLVGVPGGEIHVIERGDPDTPCE